MPMHEMPTQDGYIGAVEDEVSPLRGALERRQIPALLFTMYI